VQYLLWKYEQLRRWVRTAPSWYAATSSTFGDSRSVYFATVSAPAFTRLFEVFKPNGGPKIIPIAEIERLSDL